MAQLVPLIALGLVGGALVDALDRRKVLLATSTLLALGSAALAALAIVGIHEVWPLYLVAAFQARLTDLPSPAGAEDDRVRRAAAISLGRMKATAAVPTLRRFYAGKPTLEPVTNACGWALERITGEPVPPPGVIERMDRAWFLSPLD